MKILGRKTIESIFNAGEAAVEIKTYLVQKPTTQSADFKEDAQNAIREHYSSERIRGYIRILERTGLREQAGALETDYKKLREIAGFNLSL